MKVKNCSDYLFNDNVIVNIIVFEASLLKICKVSFKRIFSLNIYYVKYIPTKSLDHVDDDKDYLYFFLDDVDGYIEESDGIKYLVFASTDKNKEALKNYKKLWEETKRAN